MNFYHVFQLLDESFISVVKFEKYSTVNNPVLKMVKYFNIYKNVFKLAAQVYLTMYKQAGIVDKLLILTFLKIVGWPKNWCTSSECYHCMHKITA